MDKRTPIERLVDDATGRPTPLPTAKEIEDAVSRVHDPYMLAFCEIEVLIEMLRTRPEHQGIHEIHAEGAMAHLTDLARALVALSGLIRPYAGQKK